MLHNSNFKSIANFKLNFAKFKLCFCILCNFLNTKHRKKVRVWRLVGFCELSVFIFIVHHDELMLLHIGDASLAVVHQLPIAAAKQSSPVQGSLNLFSSFYQVSIFAGILLGIIMH